jgi:thiol-disulfide isomerase/thioredoxin
MLKKILTIFVFAFLLAPFASVFAQGQKDVNVYFFWGDGCPHCAKEEIFLNELKGRYSNISVHDFEIWKNSMNRELLLKISKELGANVSGVPVTIIGNKVITGFSEGLISSEIENRIKYCSENECPDSIASNLNENSLNLADKVSIMPEKINLPLVGEIQTRNFSLPVFTVVLGALDGFNPCAMWTLILLISLLLGMENKMRMWILGSFFIVASALVYFVFMAAWLNLLLFIGLIFWVRTAIGLVALGGGWYSLREYFTKPEAVCDVAGTEKKQKIFERLRDITKQKNFYLAIGGVIFLAFAVNLIELICSAGLPAVYTQVLTLSNLSRLQYYLYLLLYIFVFMLDDMIVFFVAMITLKTAGMTGKYSRFSRLVGGALMLAIGLLLLFKPEWLAFG